MKRYKITLKPLEPYFFGGDLTFGKVGSKTNGSYIAKSTYFPQQSAFLGLLRKEIVECLQDYEKAKQIVGGSKFFIKSKDDTKLDFGAIRDITPLFVQQSKELFLPLQDVFAYKITKENNNFLVGGFEPKKGVLTKLFSITSDTKLSLDKVFEEKTMVGNSKKEKDNAFFKKIAIQMSECCSFVYFVEFEDMDFDLERLNSRVVFWGADRSKFLLQITEENKPQNYHKAIEEKLKEITSSDAILLLSDSYLKINIHKHCEFAITDEIPFRYISKSKNNPHLKSKQFYLYSKGSVFINPDERLKEKLNKPYLQHIGYNKFITKEEK